MREYNEMMLRPLLYPGGRVHHDPERQSPASSRPVLPASPRRRSWTHALMVAVIVVVAGVLGL